MADRNPEHVRYYVNCRCTYDLLVVPFAVALLLAAAAAVLLLAKLDARYLHLESELLADELAVRDDRRLDVGRAQQLQLLTAHGAQSQHDVHSNYAGVNSLSVTVAM